MTGALCMILVGQRRTEQGENTVSRHQADCALVSFDGLCHELQDGLEGIQRLLGIALVKELKRILDVCVQHGHQLPLSRGYSILNRFAVVAG